jgi:predicted transcriptional regulator
MIKRLPDAEFEVMKVIWNNAPPVTTLEIMEKLKSEKDWKPQTVLTMLVRLIEKGFLKSERVGRERNYTPAIQEQEYMRVETGDFMKRYSGNSVGSLVKTLYDGKNLSEEDLQELKDWLSEKRN